MTQNQLPPSCLPSISSVLHWAQTNHYQSVDKIIAVQKDKLWHYFAPTLDRDYHYLMSSLKYIEEYQK